MKLTKPQEDLLRAIQQGVTLRYMEYNGRQTTPYFYRGDNGAKCTVAAEALVRRKLIEFYREVPHGKARYRLTEAGRIWPAKETTE